MKDAAEPASPSASELHAVLLDYFSAPGKYQLTLRQPALLFSSVPEILHIAAGRGASANTSKAPEVREAAVFFIRAALLYPGADHYALLGLPSRTEPADLKERYRLLMRLIHPDFAAAGLAAWPADAAVRVNRAYEVLSSPLARREYDEQIAGARAQRPPQTTAPQQRRSVATVRRSQGRALPISKKVAWAFALAAGVVAVGSLMPSADPAHLVQKANTPRPVVQPPPQAAPRLEAEVTAAASLAEVLPPAGPAQPLSMTAPPVVTTPPAPDPLAMPASPSIRPLAPTQSAAAPTPAAPPPAVMRREPAAPREEAGDAGRAILARTQEQAPAPVAALRPATAPAPAPIPGPIPAAVAVARVSIAPASSPPVSPTLSEVQPLLTQLLHMLESGSGDQLLRLLDADARQAAAAQTLSRHYDQAVGRSRPVHLSHVDFKGEPRDGTLVVTGRIRLHVGEPTIGSHGEKFLVRAEFISRGGKVMLTGLSGGVD
jgi:hypothetical protein